MFETLFSRPDAIERHRVGPLAVERCSYLEQLSAQSMSRATLRNRASYCLALARELQSWPRDHRFTTAEIDTIASAWAAQSVARGRAATPIHPKCSFQSIATDFLRFMGRFSLEPTSPPGRYEDRIEAFIAHQRQGRWQSEATCQTGRRTVEAFLAYLEDQGCVLEHINAHHLDAFIEHLSHQQKRTSIRTMGNRLRAWLRFCEARGWTQPGLADGLFLPRLYRHEGLPTGPTWDQVRCMIDETSGSHPADLRNRAILLLLSVYGLRSGELRRLQLDDLDWQGDRIRLQRSKSLGLEMFPLKPSVGNAIARYLRHSRPPSSSRTLFLTLLPPYRPLTGGALYYLVKRYLSIVGYTAKGQGPHALRHACARHLFDSGHSFKEVGDHLGHRSPESTDIYVKVNLEALHLVAFEHLGGLT